MCPDDRPTRSSQYRLTRSLGIVPPGLAAAAPSVAPSKAVVAHVQLPCSGPGPGPGLGSGWGFVPSLAASASAERVPISHRFSVWLPLTALMWSALLCAFLWDVACGARLVTGVTFTNHACIRIGSLCSGSADETYRLITLAERATALWSTGRLLSSPSSSESKRVCLYSSG